MPYKNQFASKTGHMDIVKNPDIATFLVESDYIQQIDDSTALLLTNSFIKTNSNKVCPRLMCLAIDGSLYEETINRNFPNTRVGYVKTSAILIRTEEFENLQPLDCAYIDPFKVAKLNEKTESTTFALPSSNIYYPKGSNNSFLDSFRYVLYKEFTDSKTSHASNNQYNLKSTLYNLYAHSIENSLSQFDQKPSDPLKIYKCPTCGDKCNGKLLIPFDDDFILCPSCSSKIYCTDSLRLHELVSDHSSNIQCLSLFMNVVEHLTVASFVRMLSEFDSEGLSHLAIFIDGPLALFGQPAWLARRLMSFYHHTNQQLLSKGLDPFLLVGLQKTGQIVDHSNSINSFIPNNSFKFIDDDYRYTHIKQNFNSTTHNHGDETYYGQDLIYKTETGKLFCACVLYPFSTKPTQTFRDAKVDSSNYQNLDDYFSLINYFEMDLYENSLVPITLAHRHASISLKPGGSILGKFSKILLDS